MQDPLVVMPLLIPCHCVHAVPVIRLVSEKANAKEILLVLQEILERLGHDGEQDDEEEQEEKYEKLSPTLQLERVVFSYAYGKIVLYFTSTVTSPHGVTSFAASPAKGKNHRGTSPWSTSRSRKIHPESSTTFPTPGGSSSSSLSDHIYQ